MKKELQILEKEYQSLLNRVQKKKSFDTEVFNAAWNFAKLAHDGVRRKSGELYIFHPLHTAEILFEWGLDSTTMIAGLLHDTIEDGGATAEDLIHLFGEEVATLVDGVTKVSNLRLKGSTEDVFVETLRKMILVMARDLRVVFVKLADRTHNMRTLYALPPEKQRKIARETLEIYAPLAERLGMGVVKAELEDLCFQYLYSEEYKKLLITSKPYFKKAEDHIRQMEKLLMDGFASEKINAEVSGRKKHLYSLWKKLQRPEIDGDIDNIFDIVALRIFVNTVADCYAVLGIVHALFRPVPKLGISDFIAQPKPNGYRSIHTKVFGPDGRIVEVQIRTKEMHQQAEHGAASHWAYSEAKSHGVSDAILTQGYKVSQSKLDWVRELVKWQEQLKDSSEFLKAVKFDGFSERNFIFSPNGDVYDLPAGATPIDFAYAVHTKLAEFLQGARVNGKIVPLDYSLKSGDVVEILKHKNPKTPNRDWLAFVRTTTARREINKRLHKLPR